MPRADGTGRAHRAAKRVSTNGYIDGYSGVRISKTGLRFIIDHATVWNLLDARGETQNQAAMFSNWQILPG